MADDIKELKALGAQVKPGSDVGQSVSGILHALAAKIDVAIEAACKPVEAPADPLPARLDGLRSLSKAIKETADELGNQVASKGVYVDSRTIRPAPTATAATPPPTPPKPAPATPTA